MRRALSDKVEVVTRNSTELCGNEGLLLGLDLMVNIGDLKVVLGSIGEDLLGSDWEIVLLDGALLLGLVLSLASTLDKGLGLGGIITDIFLGDLGGLLCLLLGNGAQLLRLRVDDIASLLELLVDELLVRGVNQGRKEDDGGGNQGKAPGRDNLDKIVREESTKGHL